MSISALMTTKLRLGISAGEPAGIGPDLCLWLAQPGRVAGIDLVVAADAEMMRDRARLLGLPYPFFDISTANDLPLQEHRPLLWHHPLVHPAQAGILEPRNSQAVLNALDSLTDACQQGRLQALVTAPLQKSVIVDGGIPFTGHTEYLAQRLGVSQVVMMLVGGGLRVALATTHLPLSEVSRAITRKNLLTTLKILHHDLTTRFGCKHPRILVAGLNPHAGENGHLGTEELTTLIPALEDARALGIDALGPLPADTLFLPQRLEGCDAVLAMYHDQGLPVLKMKSFGSGVNVTLGLPIIRTSVDHGTALDRAGSGHMETGSMVAAVELAAQLARSSLAAS
ncbi:MAG: 4-hydroxythreonine-4-phosphate dehydrogenase PdxA [Ferrovum sp.]|nr:4-hydroxythreonine-4-phosphate dehydrogenase PdxA [Ferrovum sp.]NDU87608.1 4-hydroxythreonine-4-phosphate dehydrogenase PdxA [Ferrovum sp.]